jgi:DNA-binding GntR family transcriptional regulator
MSDAISDLRFDRPDGLDRPNLKAAAAAGIRERILTGRYRPGEKINQDQLADEFGVSRLPIREALIVLEGEGLVHNIARRGAFVAPVSRDDIRDHYAIFGAVAGLAAARAAVSLTKDDYKELQARIDGMRDTSALSNVDDLCFAFHRHVNLAGSTLRLRAELRRLSEGIPARLFTFDPEWRNRARTDHQRILRALKTRDPERAYDSTRDHLRRSSEFAVARLEKLGFWAEEEGTA